MRITQCNRAHTTVTEMLLENSEPVRPAVKYLWPLRKYRQLPGQMDKSRRKRNKFQKLKRRLRIYTVILSHRQG